jgi:hypothetical protein
VAVVGGRADAADYIGPVEARVTSWDGQLDSAFPADIALQVDEHGHDAHVVTELQSRIVVGRRGAGVSLT